MGLVGLSYRQLSRPKTTATRRKGFPFWSRNPRPEQNCDRYKLKFSRQAMSTDTPKQEQQKRQEELQEDNPCWGSQNHCDLEYLLSRISRRKVVAFESTKYIVLNKPPDLRMDGPYHATVHKLLTYWYPPPSLENDQNLLQAISGLHRHNDLPDNELRPCHQLDYATSGVLCVARTQEAASVTGTLFENRKVRKSYIAIVNGHLELEKSLPVLVLDHMQSSLQKLEKAYRNSRSKRRQDTFQGFQPPHALFNKYKSIKNNVRNDNKKKRKRPDILNEDQWKQIWKPVKEQISDLSSLLRLDWKQLCKQNVSWKRAFQQTADIHNSLLREELQNQQRLVPTLPMIFQIEGEEKSLYIYCPLAQVPDEFGMKIPPDKSDNESFLVGPKGLDYKPSLTKCTILETATYDGKPVTKVKLSPITGRRHQLRVHMTLCGHAILGDATYEDHKQQEPERSPPRMCLHAHSLSLALLGESQDWTVTIPDPFPIDNRKLDLTIDL